MFAAMLVDKNLWHKNHIRYANLKKKTQRSFSYMNCLLYYIKYFDHNAHFYDAIDDFFQMNFKTLQKDKTRKAEKSKRLFTYMFDILIFIIFIAG